jgi:hypothetical protein
MAAQTSVDVAGVWKNVRADGVWVNVGGVWKMCKYVHAHDPTTWRDVHVSDTTGPLAPTSLTATWTVNGLLVDWVNPTDADYNHMQIIVYHTGDTTWTQRANVTVAGPTSQWLSTYNPYNTALYVLLIPYDNLGNGGTQAGVHSMGQSFPGAARGRVPSPAVFYSNGSGTWRGGQWRTDIYANELYVYQGSSVSGKSEGAYFYGDQIFNTLYGTTITAMSFEYVRTNSTGAGGSIEPELWMSTIASKAEAFSKFGTKLTAPGVCRNGDCLPYNSVVLPSTWRAPMVTPGQPSRLRSIVMSSDDTTLRSYLGNVSESYCAFYPGTERPVANNVAIPARLTIEHTG